MRAKLAPPCAAIGCSPEQSDSKTYINAISPVLVSFKSRNRVGWLSAPRCITADTSPALSALWGVAVLQAYSVKLRTAPCFELSTLPLFATSWGSACILGSAAERQLNRKAIQIRASNAEFLMPFVIR